MIKSALHSYALSVAPGQPCYPITVKHEGIGTVKFIERCRQLASKAVETGNTPVDSVSGILDDQTSVQNNQLSIDKTTMNKLTDSEDVPFVNEECGDTMWDEAMLDQLTTPPANQQLPNLSQPVLPHVEQAEDDKTIQSKQASEEQVE